MSTENHKQFRTPTGQTGKDAYSYEAAAIANEQRELNARFRRLVDAVREESPQLLLNTTDFMFSDANTAPKFVHYLKGREHYLAYLAEQR